MLMVGLAWKQLAQDLVRSERSLASGVLEARESEAKVSKFYLALLVGFVDLAS